MTNIAIASLHFSPGFIGHMKAWYKMCKQCGYTAQLYFDQQYVKYFEGSEYKYSTDIKELGKNKPDYAVVQNTGFENVAFFKWCERNNCKIFYILHEPYMGFRELLKDGTYCVKQAVACMLNVWLCSKSAKVILCSDYAEKNCRKYMKGAYKKHARFPLIFLDEYEAADDTERRYFSLIGNYNPSKGSDLFLQFIKNAVAKGYDIDFQIATRTDLSSQLADDVFQKLISDGKLIVQHGRNMTTDEINGAYSKAICCWNGYRRSTQSGVLPNAFMLGAPVVATRIGSFVEFVEPGKTGEFIDNENAESIYAGYIKIKEHSAEMSDCCRKFFLDHFFYGNQAETFKKIVEG